MEFKVSKARFRFSKIKMLKRFKIDVIDENPYSVIILAGINDIAQNTGPISIEEIANNIITASK